MDYKQQVLGTYDSWYEKNRTAISNGEWNLIDRDILENPEKSSLTGLNLIAYLPDFINDSIDELIVAEIENNFSDYLYYIPPADRHITILDIIPHNSELSTEEIDSRTQRYSEVIENAIAKFNMPISIGIEGVFASPDGITIQGYPNTNGLADLRGHLRKELRDAGLLNLENKKYQIETAHIAIAKFTEPLESDQLIEFVDNSRDIKLPDFELNQMVLNISSRFDKSKKIKLIKTYNI